jgi:hypothetical protein
MRKINRTKLLDRKHDRRSAKLFVIATEGKDTEKQYFEMFGSRKGHWFREMGGAKALLCLC